MKEENRAARRTQIDSAAYELLQEKGYAGTSMLAIARRARASNETLYRWYGDKQGLFLSLIEANAAEVRGLLEDNIALGRAPLETLKALGPMLLGLLTGDRAVALNRAAAADGGGELGAALTRAGRGVVAPLIGQVMAQAQAADVLRAGETGELVALYLDLLVGDQQIRRAIGALPAPSEADCAARAERALMRLLALAGA
ncbi:MAG: TetR/AcrR family transcriptional regulator [Rhodobacteraceae bacterium]|nr:TetR/AcrR family transcriptional regulator [Paracoccaceae bacterium]